MVDPLWTFSDHALWLGGTDALNEGQWVWTGSQKPIGFTDWQDGEPNNVLPGEDCLELWYNRFNKYEWIDNLCGLGVYLPAYSVCETR